MKPAQKDRVKVEEIAGQQPLGLTAQKRPPRGVHLPRSWTIPLGAQNPSHGRLTQPIAQIEEFAVHAPISPPGVLARESGDYVADLAVRRRAAWLV
jgi:hypothetical protein